MLTEVHPLMTLAGEWVWLDYCPSGLSADEAVAYLITAGHSQDFAEWCVREILSGHGVRHEMSCHSLRYDRYGDQTFSVIGR